MPSFACRPATAQEQETTAQALKLHAETIIGASIAPEPFALVAYEDKKLVASAIGKVLLRWLHLDLVWVDGAFRGKGMGRELMAQVEQAATEKKLDGIEIWTQDWQAPGFYRALGYEEFAAVDDFIPGSRRHAFRRILKSPS